MKEMKQVRRKATASMLDVEDLDPEKITLEELRRERRWRMIWQIYKIKKRQFPELSDELIIKQAKQQVLAIRQLKIIMALTPDAEKLLGISSEKNVKEVEDAVKQSVTDLTRIEKELKSLKENVDKEVKNLISIIKEPIEAFKIREEFMRKKGALELTREMMNTQTLLKDIERDLTEINRNFAVKINDLLREIERELVHINEELTKFKG